MAYRVQIRPKQEALDLFQSLKEGLPGVLREIVRDAADITAQYAKQNVSGVPFESETGTHTINKRSGQLAASIQYQHPYGSPFRARIFSSAKTRYADNPEEYDYGAILEYGRGEIVPRYTPSAKAGNTGQAKLTIPGGAHQLNSGTGGFRGVSGGYAFVSRIPPMEGKYWMQAAQKAAQPDITEMAQQRVDSFIEQQGF
ncbi:HK97 gp10 family phage protein [Leptothoe spongobia]|uniref:HK97 gp10 family phage protein n=1 Tax=Leptothoe spongobia TAU-MAC 1115 TaxID=1967444 RepID=A0A947DHZ7_9CYAN|nr:HK97 gp10 family phage protein [Leptothoe spongobia]MBT9316296.1 HK97 gp10 family phage protein [Leptothoe spongobia TAU-MAC 1115]